MNRNRFWVSIFVSLVFVFGLLVQVSRFTMLYRQASRLEMEQEAIAAENRKLEAEIAVLTNRTRTDVLAGRSNFVTIQPEEKLTIIIEPKKTDTIADPLNTAKLPQGGRHD